MCLLGWLTGRPALAGAVRWLLPAAPTTAVMALLLGLALAYVGYGGASAAAVWHWCSSAAALFCFAVLVLDHDVVHFVLSPTEMSPLSAVALAALGGGAMLDKALEWDGIGPFTRWIGALVAFCALAGLVGTLGAHGHAGFGVPLPSAVALGSLGVGVLFGPPSSRR